MPKNISHRKLIQKFRKLGFSGPYSGGKHQFMKKDFLKSIFHQSIKEISALD